MVSKLNQICKAIKLSHTEIAGKAELSRNTVSSAGNDPSNVKYDNLCRILKVVNDEGSKYKDFKPYRIDDIFLPY
jgi:transcriptional regulator with XRE-family HTH domain